ncbi:MAG: putative zinc-binding metallopeptidase [Agriterribacter sp.]
MKLFTCKHCGQPLYFENYYCENCGMQLGFDPGMLEFIPFINNNNGAPVPSDANDTNIYRFCNNRIYNVCNWLVEPTNTEGLCLACELNRTIPDLNNPEYVQRWQTLELAKHRLVYSLLRLKLPLASKIKNPSTGLLFDFKADGTKKVLTGHDEGVITINIAEADDIEREMARRNMEEVYRTVLGHFRHEVGHYYWDRLIADTPYHQPFKALFGDEQQDYEEALKAHYANGAPANWNLQYISAYASAHPWEDWAETWAHYLHIIDTLETAYAFGVGIHPAAKIATTDLDMAVTTNPYHMRDFSRVIDAWLPLTIVLNSLNRSMGHGDAYPFVIYPPVLEKLRFIHSVCHPGTM